MTQPVIPGDPYGDIKKEKGNPAPSPREVNFFHSRSDVDSGVTAQHHTLGIKHNQTSPGDHNHDGKGSRKIATGMGLSISGSRGGNAALASVIALLANFAEFTDNTTP